jgi:hypothetical protein
MDEMTRTKFSRLLPAFRKWLGSRNWMRLQWRKIGIAGIVLRARLRSIFSAIRLGYKPTLASVQHVLIANHQSIGESLLEWAAKSEYGDLPEGEKLQKLKELRALMEETGFISAKSPH